jgi:hypothetical protein
MSIQQDFTELQNLNTELKRLRRITKELNVTKKKCEERILEYLHVNNHPGIRMGDVVFTAQEQKKTKRISRKQQAQKCEQLLSQYGIPDATSIVNDFLQAFKGSPQQIEVLKIRNVQQ